MISDLDLINLHNRQIVDFSVSKDLKHIAYVYGNLDLTHSLYMNDIKSREIHFFNIEKGIDLFAFKGMDQHSPSWSNDGKNIAFLNLKDNKTQISIYNFNDRKILFSSALQYNSDNAFYGVRSKDILWSMDDRFLFIPYYENGRNHYNHPKECIKSVLILDVEKLAFNNQLKLESAYKIYGILDNNIIYYKDNHLFKHDINSNETLQTKMKGHDVIKIIKDDLYYIDVNNNTVIFGMNNENIVETHIDGDLIKPIDISDDGTFSIFVLFSKMSVFLVKLMSTGKIIYLSKEYEVTFNNESHAEPKIINNKIIYVKSSYKLHNELFINDKQISFFNKEILNKLDIEITTDTYFSDYTMIETTILLPKNYRSKEKYPSLIYVHGGPNTYETMTIQNLISARGQSIAIKLCQEGFIIAMPNYRGTKGYGYKHLEKVPRFSMEFSNYVLEDIMNCRDLLLQKYSINNIGLYGSSFGALITGWIISNNNVFNAAAGIIGVSYDDDNYSVESRVENIQCPILIIETGMAEGRFKVGKKLHDKLLSHSKNVEYFIYQSAFHNGGWNDGYKTDYIQRLTNFFNKYLK